jgi:hypothetical protein
MLGLGILALSLSHCAPLTPFHTEPGLSVAGHAEKYPIEIKGQGGPDFSLGRIEFDDQGEMWNPNQLSFVVDEIKRESRRGPLMLIVFTHGWNNSARPGTQNNLKDFQNVLTGLANTFPTPEGQASPRFFGVYMGWRGRSVRGMTVVTDFWSRMSAAHRVGGGAAVTESLYAVTHSARRANRQSKVIVIGHSFGGIVMENAVGKALASQVGASPGNGASLELGADLVMLLNPAERSTYSRQLVTTLQRRDVRYERRGPGGTRVPMPMVVSLTSESDLATRWAFPVGIGFGRVIGLGGISGRMRKKKGKTSYNEPALEGSQRYALHHTPGHNPYLWSHQTSLLDYPPGDAPPLLPPDLWKQNKFPHYDPADGSLTFRTTKGLLVIRPEEGFNQTPYWIGRIDKKLVDGHSNIWLKNVLTMAVSLANMKDGLTLPNGRTLGPDRGAKPRVMD